MNFINGFIYHVKDSLGNHLAWIPYDTAQVGVKTNMAYSILAKDTLYITHTPELKSGGVSVFPNPSKGEIKILMNTEDVSAVRVMLSDIQGRELFLHEYSGISLISEGLHSYASGIYFLKITTPDFTQTVKIVKQ